MQVPLFVLVQVFHAYKTGRCPKFSLVKIWKRIVLPFLLMQMFIAGVLYLTHWESAYNLAYFALIGGGMGPGAYYPWVYIQVAILLPLFWKLFGRFSIIDMLFLFIVTCVAFEILFSIIKLPPFIFRLTAVRYIFLIYLGMIWVRRGIVINVKTICLSLFTMAITLWFYYKNPDLSPVFYNTGWKTHRWICYFYVASLLPAGLWFISQKISKFENVDRLIKIIARSSYEIFLVQMAVFVIFPPLLNSINICNPYILFVAEVIFSITIGILFKLQIIDRLSCCSR